MELFFGKYPFELSDGAFPVTTDSVLLAWFAARKGRFLDLGCGCGLLGVLMHIRAGCTVDGVEADGNAARTAAENYERCMVCGSVIQADIRTFCCEKEYDYCVFNPPYYLGKAGKAAAARDSILGGIEDFINAAARIGTKSGMFFCLPPERFAAARKALSQTGFTAACVIPVKDSADKPPFLLLIYADRSGSETTEREPLILSESGKKSKQYELIYGDEKWTWEHFMS